MSRSHITTQNDTPPNTKFRVCGYCASLIMDGKMGFRAVNTHIIHPWMIVNIQDSSECRICEGTRTPKRPFELVK